METDLSADPDADVIDLLDIEPDLAEPLVVERWRG